MTFEDRDELIGAYFDALDEEDLSIVRPALSDSFVYDSSAGRLNGFDGLRQYLEEFRTTTNSTHTVTLRVHNEEATVTEGIVTGEGPDGEPRKAGFCDVFEFDRDDRAIARVAVYLNDAIAE